MDDKPKSKGRVEAAQEIGPPSIMRRFATEPAAKPHLVKSEVAEQALHAAEKAAKPLSKPKVKNVTAKRGRPPVPKPWVDEGISRQAWTKRQKKAQAV